MRNWRSGVGERNTTWAASRSFRAERMETGMLWTEGSGWSGRTLAALDKAHPRASPPDGVDGSATETAGTTARNQNVPEKKRKPQETSAFVFMVG